MTEPVSDKNPAVAPSELSAGLGIPSDAEYLANSMQFGADMVSKYSKVCVAFKQECEDADELLRLLRLDPEIYRTEGGCINIGKVKAALANPDDYPLMPNVELRGCRAFAAVPLERRVGHCSV